MWRILVGLAVGGFIATFGYHRERKFERFSPIAWLRSVVLAFLAALFGVTVDITAGLTNWWVSAILFGCYVIAVERTASEIYKTYIKADYKPHVICKICHCNVLRVHGKYLRPLNQPTRVERKLTGRW